MNEALPKDWAHVTLGDLADYINGAAFKPTDWSSSGIPIIRIQNLTDPLKPLNRTQRKVDGRLLIQSGDLLFSWSATLDAFIWNSEPAWLNQHIFKVVPRPHVDRSFLYFLLRNEVHALINSEHLHGSTMRHINRGPFLAHTVGLPPLAKQRQIVGQIEALLARTRQARTDLTRTLLLAERHRRQSISTVFSNVELENWHRRRLEDVLSDARIGLVRAKVEQSASDGVPYIRMQHYDVLGRWNIDDVTRVKTSVSERRLFELEKDDLLFNTRNSVELVGKVALWPANRSGYVYNNNLLRLRFRTGIVPAFMRWALMAPPAAEALNSVKSATTSVAAIYQRDLMNVMVPVPSEEIQEQVAHALDKTFMSINMIESETRRSLALLDHLDQAVLVKALRGSLFSQGITDELRLTALARFGAVTTQSGLPTARVA